MAVRVALTVAPRSTVSPFDLAPVRYRVLVGDYRNRQILGELPASTLKYEDGLGTAGSATVTVPLDHPAVTRDTVWPARRVLFVEREGRVVWGGWIWTIRAGTDSLEVSAEGWWSYFRRRTRLGPWRWNDVDQLAIARGLLVLLGEDPAAMPDVDPSPASSGIKRTYEWQGHDKTAAAALEELAGITNGFEWSFTFDRRGEDSWPWPTLHLHYPYRGVRRPAPLDAALPIVGMDLTVDGTRLAQAITTFGRDNPEYPDAPWTGRYWTDGADPTTWTYPQLQDVVPMRDTEDLSILRDSAQLHRVVRETPTEIPSMTFESVPSTSDAANVEPGDVVRVRVRRGWIDLDGWFRVTSKTVDVGPASEKTSFTFVPRATAGSGP